MIAKARAVSHGAYYTEYATTKKNAEFIGSENLDADWDIPINDTPLDDIYDVEFANEGRRYPAFGKPIKNDLIVMEFSPTQEESQGWTSEQWMSYAKLLLTEMDRQHVRFKEKSGKEGVVPQTHLRESKWFAMLHTDAKSGIPHLHIIISRFYNDGQSINDTRLIAKRAARAAEKINMDKGWESAEKISEHHQKEIKNAIYDALREMQSFSFRQFKELLEKKTFIDYHGKVQHYAVDFRHDSADNIVGYRVSRGNSTYNAGDIGRQLTAKRLEATWRSLHGQEQVTVSQPRPTPHQEHTPTQTITPDRHEKVAVARNSLQKWVNGTFRIFDSSEKAAIAPGIIDRCLTMGLDSHSLENLKAAAKAFAESMEGSATRIAAAINETVGLAMELTFLAGIGGITTQPSGSGGGGGGSSDSSKHDRDDDRDWHFWTKVFGIMNSRKLKR